MLRYARTIMPFLPKCAELWRTSSSRIPYREPDRAAGFGPADGTTSFGVSIVPLKIKLGGDADAKAVAA